MAEIGSVDVPVRGVARVPISAEILEDVEGWRAVQDEMHVLLSAHMHEMVLDLEIGPRYGPPAPRIEIEEERCQHCGHVLDEDDF